MAEKSSWDQANIRQKLGLVWINIKKISQINKDYFYLPFFLLIILWVQLSSGSHICSEQYVENISFWKFFTCGIIFPSNCNFNKKNQFFRDVVFSKHLPYNKSWVLNRTWQKRKNLFSTKKEKQLNHPWWHLFKVLLVTLF